MQLRVREEVVVMGIGGRESIEEVEELFVWFGCGGMASHHQLLSNSALDWTLCAVCVPTSSSTNSAAPHRTAIHTNNTRCCPDQTRPDQPNGALPRSILTMEGVEATM